jgi:hypothetical protein
MKFHCRKTHFGKLGMWRYTSHAFACWSATQTRSKNMNFLLSLPAAVCFF